MVERRRPEAQGLRASIKNLLDGGCTLDHDGSLMTLFDVEKNPVVEISGKEKVAVFQDEYHQTAGALPELADLISSLDGLKFEVHMD